MRGEGVLRTGSSATIVPAPGESCRAAITWGDSIGSASATRGAETEGTGLEATAPEDREAGLSTPITGTETIAVEGFTAFFFCFPFSAFGGDGKLVVKDDGGTSARTVGGLDPG